MEADMCFHWTGHCLETSHETLALMLSAVTRLEVFFCVLFQTKVMFSTVGTSLKVCQCCYRPTKGKAFLVVNSSENTISISEFSLNWLYLNPVSYLSDYSGSDRLWAFHITITILCRVIFNHLNRLLFCDFLGFCIQKFSILLSRAVLSWDCHERFACTEIPETLLRSIAFPVPLLFLPAGDRFLGLLVNRQSRKIDMSSKDSDGFKGLKMVQHTNSADVGMTHVNVCHRP